MKRTVIELIILLVISSFVIFFQFNQVPKKLSWDEVEFARLALSLDNQPYTPYSELATGHSTLYFYILLASIKVFGLSNFALRFPSALFGVLNILIFYLITRQFFTKIKYFKSVYNFPFLPLLISIILVTSRWYFNFARFSFEATFLLFLELVAIYFFIRFKSDTNKSKIDLSISALFSGLTFLSYYPGRIFFLLPLLFIYLMSDKKFLKKNLLKFSSLFFLTASPLIIYLAAHKDLRIQDQFFPADKKLSITQKTSYFALNTAKLSYMFTHYGDLNGRHNYPGKATFNPIMGTFFLFGFLVTVLNLHRSYNKFFFCYFLLSLVPALFTYPIENPNSLRTFTAIISSVFFIGNGLIYLLQSEQKSKVFSLTTICLLLLLFSTSSIYDIRTYFKYQKTVFSKAFELNGNIERIIKLKLWEKTGEI